MVTRTFLQLRSVLANIDSKIVWHATRWNFSLHDATLQWIHELSNYRIYTIHFKSECEAQGCILRRSLMVRLFGAYSQVRVSEICVIVIIVQLVRGVQLPLVYVLSVVVWFPCLYSLSSSYAIVIRHNRRFNYWLQCRTNELKDVAKFLRQPSPPILPSQPCSKYVNHSPCSVAIFTTSMYPYHAIENSIKIDFSRPGGVLRWIL